MGKCNLAMGNNTGKNKNKKAKQKSLIKPKGNNMGKCNLAMGNNTGKNKNKKARRKGHMHTLKQFLLHTEKLDSEAGNNMGKCNLAMGNNTGKNNMRMGEYSMGNIGVNNTGNMGMSDNMWMNMGISNNMMMGNSKSKGASSTVSSSNDVDPKRTVNTVKRNKKFKGTGQLAGYNSQQGSQAGYGQQKTIYGRTNNQTGYNALQGNQTSYGQKQTIVVTGNKKTGNNPQQGSETGLGQQQTICGTTINQTNSASNAGCKENPGMLALRQILSSRQKRRLLRQSRSRKREAVKQSLEEEVKMYRNMHLCKICMERQIDTTFSPCGHLVCCGPCSEDNLKNCPMCRKVITSKVKTFIC